MRTEHVSLFLPLHLHRPKHLLVIGCLVQQARAENIAVRGGICPHDSASKALLLLYKGAGTDMGWSIHQKLSSNTCPHGVEIKGTLFI